MKRNPTRFPILVEGALPTGEGEAVASVRAETVPVAEGENVAVDAPVETAPAESVDVPVEGAEQ